MGLRMKNSILAVDLKIRLLGERFMKNQYRGRGLPKKGGLNNCRFKGKLGGGGVFEGV